MIIRYTARTGILRRGSKDFTYFPLIRPLRVHLPPQGEGERVDLCDAVILSPITPCGHSQPAGRENPIYNKGRDPYAAAAPPLRMTEAEKGEISPLRPYGASVLRLRLVPPEATNMCGGAK